MTQALSDALLTRMHLELHGLERDESDKVDLTRTRGFLTIQDVAMWLTARTGSESSN